jgi:2-amino-4-hydroxy-6-hydroxymethyldihydropteridine diphosphokinase
VNILKTAYLGIGGNMGDKIESLRKTVDILSNIDGIIVSKVSSVYETDPVGYTDQDVFANICVEIKTTLTPLELLEKCNYAENELGRVRLIRWGPRTVDVDVLLYEGYESLDEKLTIPHPRMWERAFVLVPLEEISADMEKSCREKILQSIDSLPAADLSGVNKKGSL